jgi:hypothetical protein
MNAEDKRFIDGLKDRPAQSLTLEERNKIATLAEGKQGRDFDEITFEYNSAKLAPSDMPTAKLLGKALTSADSAYPRNGPAIAPGRGRYRGGENHRSVH